MTPIQTIREAVVKAVPEILELKFGCEITIPSPSVGNYESKPAYYTILSGEEISGATSVCLYSRDTDSISRATISVQDGQEIKFPDWQDWLHLEILGRPIQLADVLRAIEKAGKIIYVTQLGYIFYNADINGITSANWNLSLPLDSQSPETLQFLAEILK